MFQLHRIREEAQHGPRLRKAGNSVEAFADGTQKLRVAFLEFVMPFVKVNIEDDKTSAGETREEKSVNRITNKVRESKICITENNNKVIRDNSLIFTDLRSKI